MSIIDSSDPIPVGFETAEFVVRAITPDDAAIDHAALMETREHLRLWEQSTWPADDFTVDDNRDDLVGLAQRHADRRAFTYAVISPDGREPYGCVYLFTTSAAFLMKATVTPVGDDAWAEVDAVVYFWGRLTHMEKGADAHLLAALRPWLRDSWRAEKPVYVTNERFIQQRDLLRSTDLRLMFEFTEPGKAGRYLAFG